MSNPYDNAKTRAASVLGPTLKFKGELSADEDLLIQGKIEGTIKHSSSLTIGESGHIKADTTAEYIVVEGSVDGDLHGARSVKVRETADISGNICSPSVSLVEGATFNGNIDMSGEGAAKTQPAPTTDKPVERAAANDSITGEGAEPPAGQRKKASKGSKKSADAA